MKRNNDVYFITLIDLLVQILFLGLLLFVIAKAGQEKEQADQQSTRQAMERLLNAAGVSNIAELTDELTKLAPITELKGTAEFISRAGGADAANKLIDSVKQMGGVEQFQASMRDSSLMRELVNRAGGIEKLDSIVKKIEAGRDKPPCLFSMDGEKKSSRALATVIATDEMISFERSNPDLEAVLSMLGKSYSEVQSLPFSEFSSVFSALPRMKPECRYSLRLVERTNLVHARDAAQIAFYLSISKAGN